MHSIWRAYIEYVLTQVVELVTLRFSLRAKSADAPPV